MEDMMFPPLYYLNHESSHSFMFNTQEPFTLTFVLQKKEVMFWIGGNENEMYVVSIPTYYEHDASTLVFYYNFILFLLDLCTCNEMSVIK